MKRSSDQPLSILDFDPKLSELAREREQMVRQAITFAGNSANGAAAASARAAAAQQPATPEGQSVADALRANERADETIRSEIKQSRRGVKRFFAGPQSIMLMAPLLMLPLLIIPLILSETVGASKEVRHLILPFTPMMAPMIMMTGFLAMAAQNRKRSRLSMPVTRAVLPVVARTFGEQAYVAAAVEVCDAQETLGVAQAREMMQSLNSLLASERTLEAQREAIERAMNAQSLEAARDEVERLRSRIAVTQDERARATLQESLELCEGRMEQTARLAPLRERVEAQQESIRQVMASVRSSLAGIGVFSHATENLAAAVPTHASSLRDTASRLQTQARSVETAVQEVAMLRVGG